MHLERAGSWLSVTPLGRAPIEAHVDGALSFFPDAEPHADAAIVAAADSLEDLRILHSESASHTARYALSASDDVRAFEARDGSILALGERGRVLFRSLPAYALDAGGERREARIALACESARACELTVAVDPGGPYPLMVDPTWVAGPGWPDEVVVALNSLWLRQNSETTGDVAVIDASAGPTLDSQVEAAIGDSASLFGSVTADSIKVKQGGLVTGAASYNTLDNNGTIEGALMSPLSLPLSITTPVFPVFSAGTTDVELLGGQDLTLASGSYGTVKLRAGTSSNPTVLTLSGGVYDLASLDLGDRSRAECAATCEIRIKGRLAPGENAYLGPAASSGLASADVEVFVEGINGSSGALGGTPKAAAIGISNTFSGRIFVPNGTLWVKEHSAVEGKLVAKDVQVGIGVELQNDVSPCGNIDDANPCTVDTCNAGEPVHTPAAAGSDCETDGDLCNGLSVCDGAGTCVPGSPPDVDDQNPCTDDGCDGSTGVFHVASPAGSSLRLGPVRENGRCRPVREDSVPAGQSGRAGSGGVSSRRSP